jgi:hypothetical protein
MLLWRRMMAAAALWAQVTISIFYNIWAWGGGVVGTRVCEG